MSESNNDHVICPNCVHQFRAIPVNVQAEIDELRAYIGDLPEAQNDLLKINKANMGVIDELRARVAELEQGMRELKHD